MSIEYTDEEQAVIDGLRGKGFVVILWTPEEVGLADADTLEDVAIQRGNEYLSDFLEEEEE